MRHDIYRKTFVVAMALALISLIFLWSFNVLSEAFGGPLLQFKHAVAAVGLLLVIKWARRHHGRYHDCREGFCGH